MKLDRSYRDEVAKDYRKIEGIIDSRLGVALSENETFCPATPNRRVVDPDYITPSVDITKSVPIEDLQGEFKYFTNLRKVLEKLLIGEDVHPEELKHFRFPY